MAAAERPVNAATLHDLPPSALTNGVAGHFLGSARGASSDMSGEAIGVWSDGARVAALTMRIATLENELADMEATNALRYAL